MDLSWVPGVSTQRQPRKALLACGPQNHFPRNEYQSKPDDSKATHGGVTVVRRGRLWLRTQAQNQGLWPSSHPRIPGPPTKKTGTLIREDQNPSSKTKRCVFSPATLSTCERIMASMACDAPVMHGQHLHGQRNTRVCRHAGPPEPMAQLLTCCWRGKPIEVSARGGRLRAPMC